MHFWEKDTKNFAILNFLSKITLWKKFLEFSELSQICRKKTSFIPILTSWFFARLIHKRDSFTMDINSKNKWKQWIKVKKCAAHLNWTESIHEPENTTISVIFWPRNAASVNTAPFFFPYGPSTTKKFKFFLVSITWAWPLSFTYWKFNFITKSTEKIIVKCTFHKTWKSPNIPIWSNLRVKRWLR